MPSVNKFESHLRKLSSKYNKEDKKIQHSITVQEENYEKF